MAQRGSFTERRPPTIRELRQTGTTVVLQGDNDQELEVWVQKVTPDDFQEVLHRASARRAEVTLELQDHESVRYKALLDIIADWDKDTLVAFLVQHEVAQLEEKIYAEVSLAESSDWWDDDLGYSTFEDIRIAWVGTPDTEGLRAIYARDPEDPHAKRVFEAMQHLIEEVDARTAADRDQVRAMHEPRHIEDLRGEVIDKYADLETQAAYHREFETAQVFVATRHADERSQRVFSNVREVRDNPDWREQILVALREMRIDPTEGKGQPAAPSSSRSSGPAGDSETQEGLSPTAASA